MIARVSSEYVELAHLVQFHMELRREILPAYESANGILSLLVLQRSLIAYDDIMIVSLWESEEAARNYANSERVRSGSVKELGIITHDPFAFEVLSTWSSEDPT